MQNKKQPFLKLKMLYSGKNIKKNLNAVDTTITVH